MPTLMGIPAGGSLTADQWLLAATVVIPIAVSGFLPFPNDACEAHLATRYRLSGMSIARETPKLYASLASEI